MEKINLSYNQFVSIVINTKKLNHQHISEIQDDYKHYSLFAFDGPAEYVCELYSTTENSSILDYEENYLSSANKLLEKKSFSGLPLVSSSVVDKLELYTKKKCYKETITAGQINIFDFQVSTQKRINGGEYWIFPDDVSKVHKDDIIEFAIVDKDDVLGLFSYYGLTVGQDVLEITKYIINDYVKKGNASEGYYTQLFENVEGSSPLLSNLYMRVIYDSYGTENLDLIWRIFYYE